MACGCPVAASEIPALLEATAGIAVLFNPLEVDDIARAMLKMATQPDLLVALGKQGLARVQSQRPANVASNLLAAYRTATQHHPGEALE
jgi:glycosyltransferase involved in cell wall biosynthesis